MILRRLSQHLKEQNWIAVGLEVIVVIVGIFLGMQVTEWYENRSNREAEREYLHRIMIDVATDLESYKFSQQLATQRISQIKLVQKIASKPELSAENPAQFVSSVERGAWKSSLPVKARAWEELVSSGRTLLIEDTDIRNGLFEYYRNIERWDVILDDFEARKKFINATAGLLSSEHLTAIEEASMNDKLDQDFISVSPAEALEVAIELSENKEALRWLPKMIHYHVLANKVIERRVKESEELLSLMTNKVSEE